jgi:acetyl-CoA carboxylase biotin carboxylase subunit
VFQKVLIANRGEIALRVIRACKELGIETVAVYSEADKNALHVHAADEAVCIGPPLAAQSYLNVARIISAAEVTNVDAIHPGYGFLAENAQFAEICQECNITFIGPTPENINRMGDKAEAKRTALHAKVPVVPGSDGPIDDPDEALKVAQEIGFPIMVKATAGGGGKGMRMVRELKEFQKQFLMARTEAEAAFGDPSVYLEKCIINPKHVEIQVLADAHGNVIHLGERDCSVQRRHQKLIEESPCPVMTPQLRKKMGQSAVAAAAEIKYVGAGTIEFLLDDTGHYYFMEMNTRVQVEHPVTEMVTSIDIVREQILAAMNETLSVRQEDVRWTGHCLECRVNAEDPARNFMPSPGRLISYLPPGGPGVRVDSACYQDYVIPPFYDSMIAKVIVWDLDRPKAVRRMIRALNEFVIEGVHTTIPFHLNVLDDEVFGRGDFGTGFVEDFLRRKSETVAAAAS